MTLHVPAVYISRCLALY